MNARPGRDSVSSDGDRSIMMYQTILQYYSRFIVLSVGQLLLHAIPLCGLSTSNICAISVIPTNNKVAFRPVGTNLPCASSGLQHSGLI